VNFVETIREAIDRHNLIPDATRVVVGVSGGADSVALLRALHVLGFSVTVAHLNHQLRGPEADADEQFVRELAEQLGFPVTCKCVDVKQLATENGLSTEMAARRARHGLFAEFDNAVIALAHTADDQAETFILKLARGAGPDGLSGMPFFQRLNNLRIIRPMLDLPRSAIIQWLEENGFEWREDTSNRDEIFLRNRVRHTVLPLLERELNPNLRNTILRTMDVLREENEWMDSLLMEKSLEDLPALPLAARRRVLRRWLIEHGASKVDFDAVEKILSLVSAGEGTTFFELNDRQRVVIEYGKLRFEAHPPQQATSDWMITIEPGTGWHKDHGKGVGSLPAAASFDAAKIGDSPIEVRGWEPGDRIAPRGMKGSCKLQDILTDQKIPQAQRSLIPVVVCRGEIIWIPGYRTARGWEVQGADGKAIHVRIEQNHTE
jgi:tRNA(Ile)-lysidine synthase